MDNKIYNPTFGGLTFFYRDTTLSENLISKYKVGQILMERGFTDMSYKSGGLTTNLRYLIASTNAKDITIFDPEHQEFESVVLSPNAFFKVLDIYKIGDKTQIFLLEIPATAVKYFASIDPNTEEGITQKARKNFDSKINSEPIPELQTKEWKERTEFPIGMDDKGKFFYKADKSNQTNDLKIDPEPKKNKYNTAKNIKSWFVFW